MNRSIRFFGNSRIGRGCMALATALPFLTGCGTYVPDGATVISVKDSPIEFERAEIQPAQNELGPRGSVKMKWYDTNTFLTTATLSPGLYSFRARNFDGGGFQEDIRVEAGKDLYELDGARKKVTETDRAAQEGPAVAGKVQGYVQGNRAASVSVLFIGNEIVMRTTSVKPDGSFSVDAPYKGRWRVEVHMLGQTPRSYVHRVADISQPTNLGNVVLK